MWTPQRIIYRPQKTVAGFAGGLGRRSAPAGIGAYYSNLPRKQISFGYYDAVGATANKFDVTSPTDQELLNLLQSQQPLGPFIPWAERAGDLDWNEVQPSSVYQLFAVTQKQLDDVQAATGEPVTTVAILSSMPSSVTQIEDAFNGSRYEWLKTEAVYARDDVNEPPTIIFLHVGMLRPVQDIAGRSSDEVLLARTLNGSLTYPVEEPLGDNDRDPPNETFEQALQMQFPPEQVRTALVSPQEEMAARQEAAAASGSMMRTVLFIGVAGTAGYLIYRWLR